MLDLHSDKKKMANYIIAKKHYANEDKVFEIISKDAEKRGLKLNKNHLREFLADDATIVLNKKRGCGTYGPEAGNNFVYMLQPNFSTKNVMIIITGNREVIGDTPYGTKQIAIANAEIIWTIED